jgi:hypothetical protein
MPDAVHIFLVISVLTGQKPMAFDLENRSFDTIGQCKEYVEAHPQEIQESLRVIRGFINIPDGIPYVVRFGCRGKEKIST